MKKLRKMLLPVLTLVWVAAAMLVAPTAAEASGTLADSTNGDTGYYAFGGTIYRIDTRTGKTGKIRTLPDVTDVSGVVYSGGYLFFEANYYLGTDNACTYICRMKPNGKSFKVLAPGRTPVVYGNKIYYVSGEEDEQDESRITNYTGISRMARNGKSQKKISSAVPYTLTVCGGKVLYETGDELHVMTATGKKDRRILSASWIQSLYSDGTRAALIAENASNVATLYTYTASSGKLKKYVEGEQGSSISTCGFYGGFLYFSKYTSDDSGQYHSTLYRKKLSNGKTYTIRKFDGLATKTIYTAGSKWMILYQHSSLDIMKNIRVARMRLNGKSYRCLKESYES